MWVSEEVILSALCPASHGAPGTGAASGGQFNNKRVGEGLP